MFLPNLRRRDVDSRIERYALELNHSPVLARVLGGRRLIAVDGALHPLATSLEDLDDEQRLADMERAAQRLADAILSREVIGIATDYDMDGLGGHAAFRRAVVKMFGHPPQRLRSYIGHRLAEGYGLTQSLAGRVIEEQPAVLVTADCGSSDEPRIALLLLAGIDVIVTDHHDLPREGPPRSAYACVNPQRSDCDFPDKAIAGGMVLWYLLRAVQRILIDAGHAPARQASLPSLLDLIGCSTVADCVSMASRNNRAVVNAGLALMNARDRPCWDAMAKLMKISEFTAESIAFGVAPRINARTRLADPFAALYFLLARDLSSARASLRLLDAENQARKEIERRMIEDLMPQAARLARAGRHAITLALPDGHPGVQGICSSRLVEAFGRPVFLFSPHAAESGMLTGSARTVEGINVKEILLSVDGQAPGLIQRFGGHKAAAGAQVRAEDFDLFATLFERAAAHAVAGEPLMPLRWSDGELSAGQVTWSLFEELKILEPTGRGFEAASFDGAFQVIGLRQMGDGTHLRLELRREGIDLKAVWFRARRTPQAPLPVKVGEHAHFVFSLAENTFNGRRLELRISARVQPPSILTRVESAPSAEHYAPVCLDAVSCSTNNVSGPAFNQRDRGANTRRQPASQARARRAALALSVTRTPAEFQQPHGGEHEEDGSGERRRDRHESVRPVVERVDDVQRRECGSGKQVEEAHCQCVQKVSRIHDS